ncbi:PatA/PatG family cyanobactin maturation protease [Nonomuraea rhizosphaerae]|uniref:PatA/PatG family cyanobactin maturation protease n=1 Tax=Nonomuraea rhizosphaerae TaxID=2665663 RepID=UPI0027E34954|nr:PatA/PatG family cyanobactin maturation protease [Nonomuraea rhizosphaerae]
MPEIAGLAALWRLTRGDERVRVAVLDGAVDHDHATLREADLSVAGEFLPEGASHDGVGAKAAHGTAVASVLFGRGRIPGVAPASAGVLVPVFSDRRPTSQLDLARGIETAVDAGAHVINISGGQLTAPEAADDLLVRAVRRCQDENVLIVAAAGNDGCFCDHVPATLPGVLAVGALDDAGRPLAMSNWGPGSQRQGVLAPGENITVAVPGGGTTRRSGTSLATPIVAGVAALLLSLQAQAGRRPDPHAVADLLLTSADRCDLGEPAACTRFLIGKLNITKAVNVMRNDIAPTDAPPAEAITDSVSVATDTPSQADAMILSAVPALAPAASVSPSSAACQCPDTPAAAPSPAAAVAVSTDAGAVVPSADAGCSGQSLGKVFALGSLAYDFGTEARRDTFKQLMPPVDADGTSVPANPYDPRQMVDYLRANPSEARPLIWTLNLDLTPIYAIEPVGGYGPGIYERLTEFLERQLRSEDDAEFLDRISVPGQVSGRTAKLFNGQHVPVVEVELTRGLYGWSVTSLARAVTDCGVPEHNQHNQAGEPDRLRDAVADFLQRIYYDLRNFGTASRDRALNFAATNAVQARQTLAEALGRGMALQNIDVEKSPYGRPDSDTWDVKLRFFDPDNSRRAKRVYRFSVDVKDVMPVTVGEVRSWPEA